MSHAITDTESLTYGKDPQVSCAPSSAVLKSRSSWGRMWAHSGARAGMLILAAYIVCALFAPYLAPYSPGEVNLASRLVPPSITGPHILGTDQLGRDILSRILYGARVSILVGLATTAISAVVGITLGMISGYIGSTVDTLVSRASELLLAFPYLIFVIGAMAIMGPGFWNLVWALSFKGWVEFYRVARALSMAEKRKDYVEAARGLGRPAPLILVAEILPNIQSSMLVLATMRMGNMIVMESSLSFLGLGIPPRLPAWGSMINDGRRFLMTSWWVSTLPGIALAGLVLAMNLLGEGMRDVLDPKLVNGR